MWPLRLRSPPACPRQPGQYPGATPSAAPALARRPDGRGRRQAILKLCNFTAIRWLVSPSPLPGCPCRSAPLLVAVFSALVWREALPQRVYLPLGTALIGTAPPVHPSGRSGGGRRQPQAFSGHWALPSVTPPSCWCSRALSTAAPPPGLPGTVVRPGRRLAVSQCRASGPAAADAWSGWALLAYLGIIATGLAYSLFLLGMRRCR